MWQHHLWDNMRPDGVHLFSPLLDPTITKFLFMPCTLGKVIAGIQRNAGGIHCLHTGQDTILIYTWIFLNASVL